MAEVSMDNIPAVTVRLATHPAVVESVALVMAYVTRVMELVRC